VDLRNSRRNKRLLLGSDSAFMGITHVRGHESSLVVRLSAVDALPELGKEIGGAWCPQGGRRLSQASCQSGLPAPTQEGPPSSVAGVTSGEMNQAASILNGEQAASSTYLWKGDTCWLS
jgi:hypothetical protein